MGLSETPLYRNLWLEGLLVGQFSSYPLLRIRMDGVPMRLVMETVPLRLPLSGWVAISNR
jgi:hypothetical protein